MKMNWVVPDEEVKPYDFKLENVCRRKKSDSHVFSHPPKPQEDIMTADLSSSKSNSNN